MKINKSNIIKMMIKAKNPCKHKRNMIAITKKLTIKLWYSFIIGIVIICQTKGRSDNYTTIPEMDLTSIYTIHENNYNNNSNNNNFNNNNNSNNNNNNNGGLVIEAITANKSISDNNEIGQNPRAQNSAPFILESDSESKENSSESFDCITIREHKECFTKDERRQPNRLQSIINRPKEEQVKIKYAKQAKQEKKLKYMQKYTQDYKLDTSTMAITTPSPIKGTKRTTITTNGQMQLPTLTPTRIELLAPHTGNFKESKPLLATIINKSQAQTFSVEPQKESLHKENIQQKEEEKLIDRLKLQEIVTDGNNQPIRTKTISKISIQKESSKINSTNNSDISTVKTHYDLRATFNNTIMKTVWNKTNLQFSYDEKDNKNRVTMSSSPSNSTTTYNDFTGKLLAEKDGAIKEIEQKFKLKEFIVQLKQKQDSNIIKEKLLTTTLIPLTKLQKPIKVNKFPQINLRHYDNNNVKHVIEKRVKKSFEFPMHISSNISNRKFTTIQQKISPTKSMKHAYNESHAFNDLSTQNAIAMRLQPEFSTTKFYNSKEFYHDRQQQTNMPAKSVLQPGNITIYMPKYINLNKAKDTRKLQNLSEYENMNQTKKYYNNNKTSNKNFIKKHNNKLKKALDDKRYNTQNFTKIMIIMPKTLADNLSNSANAKLLSTATIKPKRSLTSTNDYTNIPEYYATSSTTPWERQSLSREKVESKSKPELATVRTYFNITKANIKKTISTNSSKLLLESIPKKLLTKAIVHSNKLSMLQEKINSLECDLQIQLQDLQIWRSNTTHELILPKMTPENCKMDVECSAMMVSWEGESEIQSGDTLIIEINDALLNPKEIITNTTNHKDHYVQVYQVTRSGHEHCDVTEGILLDITPLIIDDRKLVTLYDKDLTEGVNFLIVVYEGWGSQCVRLKVTMKTDNCGDNSDCSAKGLCYTTPTMEEYECQCCSGFSGSHCEEIDACTPSPCTNNGICVDLSQGHEGNSYQCLCPYGYTGKNCQYELDPCNPTECMNGGSCVGNSTHFRCECLPGFIGPLCQHSLNKCESSPCIHGICVDQGDGFRCFCQPGFAGELCNFEYNECESNPCLNQGECIDHIGSYECRCTKGYTGTRCHIKVDFCANKPCPTGHKCLDHGNDYSCECPGGRNGPECNQIQRTKCNVNPCTHGGTCWSSGDSFYCACRPGFTGTMCEDEYVVETVISSSEFIVDDSRARHFNDQTYDSAIVIKSPIELHNAYFAAAVLAATIFIVAIVLIICHCKVNHTYRKFSTRSYGFIPILGFGRRQQIQNKFNKHWLSGKNVSTNGNDVGGNRLRSAATPSKTSTSISTSTATTTATTAIRHYNLNNNNVNGSNCNNEQGIGINISTASSVLQNYQSSQLHEQPFQRSRPINLENDMYYTVDFGEATQHAPLIQ